MRFGRGVAPSRTRLREREAFYILCPGRRLLSPELIAKSGRLRNLMLYSIGSSSCILSLFEQRAVQLSTDKFGKAVRSRLTLQPQVSKNKS